MTQNFYQEFTGLKLQSEKAEYITASEYDSLHNKIFEAVPYDNTITRQGSLWEFYFLPNENYEDYQCSQEQFLISVSTEKEDSCITLKKRSSIGDFTNERSSKINRKQFRELLLENYNWMKHSSELLLLEFYNKIKLWKLKIGILLECTRNQMYLKREKLMVTLDSYRAIPSSFGVHHKNSLYDQMIKHSCRVTVKDICSNYLGMTCSDILYSIGYPVPSKQPCLVQAN